MLEYRPKPRPEPRDHDVDEPWTIRTFAVKDREAVERLADEGLLPDQIGYEAGEASRIERTYLASKHGHFWVAEAEGRIIGTIAIDAEDDEVGHIHWLRVAPGWQPDRRLARALARTAAAYAREKGFLKLVLHVPGEEAQSRVADYLHLLGFEFSRSRKSDGADMLEFYLNLYERPQLNEDDQPPKSRR